MKKMQFKVKFDPLTTDVSSIVKALDGIGIKASSIVWSQVRDVDTEAKEKQ